jgi:hypothetical protein
MTNISNIYFRVNARGVYPMAMEIIRLEFDQLTPDVQAALRPRVDRLGYLGEFFRCTGHQPAILMPFMEMTEALKNALPDRLTEVGALTVAMLMANDYERNQHEQLCHKLGFGQAWIAEIERLSPDGATDMTLAERAVQRLIIATIERNGKGVAQELSDAAAIVGVQEAIAILFLVGRYVTHAMIVNALALAPPVNSIFEKEE